MKAKEMMELYNITRVTLSNWVKNGKIKYTIKPSGHYDYHPHHIPKQQEIVEDMISIIHHFSSKLYSNRKRKKIIDTIKDVNS